MKLEELMIGDWVYVHEPECRGHQIDYICLMDEEVGADGELYSPDDLRPIPLTMELLERNGLYQLYTDFYDLDMFEFNDGLFRAVYSNCEFSGIPDQSVLISYVHELQHFLSHLLINKEIEL